MVKQVFVQNSLNNADLPYPLIFSEVWRFSNYYILFFRFRRDSTYLEGERKILAQHQGFC
jgi:hypothetical protein